MHCGVEGGLAQPRLRLGLGRPGSRTVSGTFAVDKHPACAVLLQLLKQVRARY